MISAMVDGKCSSSVVQASCVGRASRFVTNTLTVIILSHTFAPLEVC